LHKKSVGRTLLDVLEKYIPAITFAVMFACFVIQIICRYFLHAPQNWTNETISICFVWTIMLGSCLAHRDGEHVVFSLVYDECGPKGRHVLDLISNGLCAVLFGYFLIPTFRYLLAQTKKNTPILHVSYAIVYAPFAVLILVATIRQIIRFVQIVRQMRAERLAGPAGESAGGGEKK